MAEMQSEEQEALVSIYEGDDNFKQVDGKKVFHYKVRISASHFAFRKINRHGFIPS